MKEIRVNKYIKNQCKQIHAYKVIGRRREEKKKIIKWVFIMNYLIYIQSTLKKLI